MRITVPITGTVRADGGGSVDDPIRPDIPEGLAISWIMIGDPDYKAGTCQLEITVPRDFVIRLRDGTEKNSLEVVAGDIDLDNPPEIIGPEPVAEYERRRDALYARLQVERG